MTPGPQKKFDRDKVLERAMQLFWEQGYEGTGMAQLLKHVGIGRQSLYDTFGDKHKLYLEALDHYFRTRVGPMLDCLKAPGSAVDSIQGVFKMLEKMSENGDFYGCLVGNSSAELAYTDPGMSRRLARYFRIVEDAFCETIRRGQEEGEISQEISARDLARTFVHVVQGLALLSRVLRDRRMVRSVTRTALAMLKAG